MKRNNLLIAAAGITASFVMLYACQKGINGLTQAKPTLTASSTNVAVGQTVSLSVANAPLGTHNVWATSSLQHTLFSNAAVHNNASVAFTKPGTYVITCFIVSGAGADSIPYTDTTTLPRDTVVYYPPVHDTLPGNPHDSSYHPGDTTHYPVDTTYHPGDTTHHPVDSTYYPGDTTHHPVDSTFYPGDTTHHHADTIHYPGDSTTHFGNGHTVVSSVNIVIVVH